ncbi:MAG: tetratricopeptide repeat protein [Treponema sp.]|jgi:tetratricopeptide (TPR) repeat protein|nr:tetratricopeptide repeat protein [Treponema sp.]
MKRGKVSTSNPEKAAHITGHYGIAIALIGLLGVIISSTVKPSKQQVLQGTEEIRAESLPAGEPAEPAVGYDHIVLPEPEKPRPEDIYRHNVKAKQLLDKIRKMPDREIKPLLDDVFGELDASHRSDDKFGETYYFYGVAYFELGDHYIAIDNTSQAVENYNESLYNFNKSEHSYIHRSNVYFDRGKTYSAIASIYQDGDSEKAREYYQEALDDFNKALDDNYSYPENIYFVMGIIYDKTGEYQRAKDCYTDALKTANDKYKPTRSEIYFNRSNVNFRLGMACFLKEDYEDAVQYYEESINDNHENFSAHFELGKTYTFQKRWPDAVRKFKFILEQKPGNFDLKTVEDSLKYASSMAPNMIE